MWSCGMIDLIDWLLPQAEMPLPVNPSACSRPTWLQCKKWTTNRQAGPDGIRNGFANRQAGQGGMWNRIAFILKHH